MSPESRRNVTSRVKRWGADRAVRAAGWLILALLWLPVAIDEGGLHLLRFAFSILAALAFLWELHVWRTRGRYIEAVSADPPELTPEQQAHVGELLANDDDVAAVRFVREQTGSGLLAAKRAVDATAATSASSSAAAPRSG